MRRRQAQKTIDLIRQLLSMELNFINIHHPDFIGTHIEKVRVEATAEEGADDEEGEADALLHAARVRELAVGVGMLAEA